MLRPRSILQLVLIGFGVATVPLIVAFVATAVLVSDLSHTGQQAILRAARVVEQSRLLVEQADAMERNGRQYLVLEDQGVLEVYQQRRTALRQAVTGLSRLDLTDRQRVLLAAIEKRDHDLHRRLTEPRPSGAGPAGLDPGEFAHLTALARGVLQESGELINKNIQTLGEGADWVQQLLLWESVALVPAAIALGGGFLLLIVPPLRVLNLSINRLGSGRFDEPVAIRGPRDLQALGEKLEWMRKRLLELENHKSLFLRNISHELKTPLTTLREGAQLLKEEVVGPLNDEQREVIELLHENVMQLQWMIEDLLHFSISQTTLLHLENQPVALAGLVHQVLDEQQLSAQAKQLTMEAALAPIIAHGDRMKLKAVFGNLVSNAIKFSPLNSPIRVSLTKDADWAVFEIQDSGPGIDDAERERVFEAFVQGRAQNDGYVKGSGLGLFIAREFVRLHGGTIDVMDSKPGAHLRVRLPLVSADEGRLAVVPVDSGNGHRAGSSAGMRQSGEKAAATSTGDTG